MQTQASTFRPSAVTPSAAIPLRRRDDVALIELMETYGAHGGLATTDELISLMRPHWRQPISILSKWVLGRRVVSFNWRTQLLLPMLQFEHPRMNPNQAVADCSIELGVFMDDQSFAEWFVRPCEWLGQRMPLSLLVDDPDAVIDAAGRTRFALMARRFAE